MERHRTIAGSPVRSSTETWDALTDLIVATLDASSNIDAASVRNECEGVAATLSTIIAADCLGDDRLTLVADPVHAHLHVATGVDAFDAERDERLDAIPGGATATRWRVYVDPPALLDRIVKDGLSTADHFVIGRAPKPTESTAAARKLTVDLDALKEA